MNKAQLFVQYRSTILSHMSCNGHVLLIQKFPIIFTNAIVPKIEANFSDNELFLSVPHFVVSHFFQHLPTPYVSIISIASP